MYKSIKILSSFIAVSLLATPAIFGVDGIFDKHVERSTQSVNVTSDVDQYLQEIKKLEAGIERLKRERDLESQDVNRFSDMNFRVSFLEMKIDRARNGIVELRSARTAKEVDAAKKKIEVQLADVQANIYGTKAE